jgi:glycerophosphoryl diester phosphodiesterase
VKLVSYRGNSVHAPANTHAALISAYTGGADALMFGVETTKDGHIVVASEPSLKDLVGKDVSVAGSTLDDLRKLDVSKTFLPRGSKGFSYRPPHRHQLELETYPDILDLLPPDAELLVELRPGVDANAVLTELVERERIPTTLVWSEDAAQLAAAKKLAPDVRTLTATLGSSPDDQLRAMRDAGADGLVTELGNAIANELQGLAVGAVLIPQREPVIPTVDEWDAVAKIPNVYGVATASTFDVAAFARSSWVWLEESFSGGAGKDVDTTRFRLGYAKVNSYAHVFQDDGVHVKIAPYDGPVDTVTSNDPTERHLQQLQEQIWNAAMTWPMYSGGGVGVVDGVDGPFAVEVDFRQDLAQQGTMCELAVTNVDPGAHQPPWNPDGSPRYPQSVHDKANFFNPHGAPPFVGSEHDEDDGYRINWNLGSEYDDNQYGRPVGDGKVTEGRLRLERRAAFFAAYYRNDKDATDWVCTGAASNESMNPRVYLRVAGKRWRQEDPTDPSKFSPVPANEFVFSNLAVTRFEP